MNTQVTVAQRTEHFVAAVLADKTGVLEKSLPAHIKPQRFRRNLSTAVAQHPKLLQCEPAAVFLEVAKAAALGLLLDPQLGEAYLITGWSKDGDVPQLRLGYRGLIKLARQSGEVASIYAHEVCDLDRFSVALGTDKKLIHEPNYLTERGKVIMYYAVVHYRDGVSDFEPMSMKEILAIRDRSDAYRAFKAGKIKSTPWSTDEGEMAKKTVLRRLLKRIPQSPELADALAAEDAEFVEVTPTRVETPRAAIQRPKLAVKAEPEEPEAEHEASFSEEIEAEEPTESDKTHDVTDHLKDSAKYATSVEAMIDQATDVDALISYMDAEVQTDDWAALKEADPQRGGDLKQRAKVRVGVLRKGGE